MRAWEVEYGLFREQHVPWIRALSAAEARNYYSGAPVEEEPEVTATSRRTGYGHNGSAATTSSANAAKHSTSSPLA
jgi:hypothetical protein